MSYFASIFYEGIVPANPTTEHTQKMYPCDINISNGTINVDYFSSYKKNNKLGSASMDISGANIGESRSFPISMLTLQIVTVDNGTKAFTFATFGKFPGKKLLGKQVQTAELNEITNAIHNAKKTMETQAPQATNNATPQTSQNNNDVIYSYHGARGRHLSVYKDKCVIKTKVTAGSIFTGNATDGEKTIYYVDCIGVQFRPAGALIGYLQLETASSSMNNKRSDFFNENSFTFEKTQIPNHVMEEVTSYIKSRIEEYKTAKSAPATTTIIQNTFSPADEIKKYKELLDIGAITQEEFDAKKKEFLGL